MKKIICLFVLCLLIGGCHNSKDYMIRTIDFPNDFKMKENDYDISSCFELNSEKYEVDYVMTNYYVNGIKEYEFTRFDQRDIEEESKSLMEYLSIGIHVDSQNKCLTIEEYKYGFNQDNKILMDAYSHGNPYPINCKDFILYKTDIQEIKENIDSNIYLFAIDFNEKFSSQYLDQEEIKKKIEKGNQMIVVECCITKR